MVILTFRCFSCDPWATKKAVQFLTRCARCFVVNRGAIPQFWRETVVPFVIWYGFCICHGNWSKGWVLPGYCNYRCGENLHHRFNTLHEPFAARRLYGTFFCPATQDVFWLISLLFADYSVSPRLSVIPCFRLAAYCGGWLPKSSKFCKENAFSGLSESWVPVQLWNIGASEEFRPKWG